MADLKDIERVALEAARQAFGAGVVEAHAREVDHADGAPALRIDIIVKQFDPQWVTSNRKLEMTQELLRFLKDAHDDRYPLVHFIEQWEWALPAAE